VLKTIADLLSASQAAEAEGLSNSDMLKLFSDARQNLPPPLERAIATHRSFV
jgi:hypothetical protein